MYIDIYIHIYTCIHIYSICMYRILRKQTFLLDLSKYLKMYINNFNVCYLNDLFDKLFKENETIFPLSNRKIN